MNLNHSLLLLPKLSLMILSEINFHTFNNFINIMQNKISILIILILFTVTSDSFSQSGWFWQNPLPQGNNLNCVTFVNSQTGFAVGNFGTISKTTNSGESWIVYYSDIFNDIYSIAFTDESNIFAVGSNGLLIRTTNSGISWNRLTLASSDSLRTIYFYNSSTGYITGNNGRIFKTANGGNEWIEQISGTTVSLNSAYFKNFTDGFIGGDHKILRTTNGGSNWSVSDYNVSIHDFYFPNENTGFAVSGFTGVGNNIRKSTNGGTSWLPINVPSTYTLKEIQFINSLTGFAFGNSSLLKTTNSGLNWSLSNISPGEGINLFSAFFLNTGECYSVGMQGTIMKSTNSGNSWTQKAPSGPLENYLVIDFPVSSTGFAMSDSHVYKTVNGGNNWISLGSKFSSYRDISFLDVNTGYAIAFPKLLKTTSGGAIWNVLRDSVSDMEFLNANTGFYKLFSNPIYRSTNGGLNWLPVFSPGSYIYNFDFLPSGFGFALTSSTVSNYSLYRTSNIGSNWNLMSDFMLDSLISFPLNLEFVNSTTGFLSVRNYDNKNNINYYIFWKTSNTGINWNRVYLDSIREFQFNDKYVRTNFINENTGFIVGLKGKMLKSTDQGISWIEYTKAESFLNDIDFIDNNLGFIAGDLGLIKKTTTGGVIAVQNISSSVPSGYILRQNYPNPFNPNTVITYDLPANNFVTLKIFDIIGKEIMTLVNSDQQAGIYNVEFKGENLPSGIYFYKLILNDLSETRKMVLLK